MIKEELEKSAEGIYTKDEIKILLKGFDIGYAQARKLIKEFLNN